MFDIGFLELTLILVLALLVLGPERLPKAARTVGYWFGKARRYVEGMKTQVEAELDASEVKRLLHNQEVQIRELQDKLQNSDDYINNEYHNQFADNEDPNTAPEAEPGPEAQQKDFEKAAQQAQDKAQANNSHFEMIEEQDERWDELEETNLSSGAIREANKQQATPPVESQAATEAESQQTPASIESKHTS